MTHEQDPSVSEQPPAPDQVPAGSTSEQSAEPASVQASPAARWPWRRILAGLLLVVLGAGLQFLILASDQRFTFSVLLGLVSCAVAAVGALLLVGRFRAHGEPASHTLTFRQLLRPLLELLLCATALLITLKSAVLGVIPRQVVVCAVLVPTLFLCGAVATFRVGRVLGAYGPDSSGVDLPWYRRHGFWLVLLASLIYLPLLGSFSLIDPWESHYGEVAREMLARDDWISLWWAQDGWFWSKPILDFWLQGLSFSLLGVQYGPDQMLQGIDAGRWPQPEWAARFPIFLITLLANYVLYRSVARFFGRRAAFLGSVLLITTPYWLLIARQTMTDMPYVAALTAAMGFLLLGLYCGDEKLREVELHFARARVRLSGMHLLLGIILLSALPQVCYLTSRNVTLHWAEAGAKTAEVDSASVSLLDLLRGQVRPRGFHAHEDQVSEGSGGGNCGLPGNGACRKLGKLHNERLQPALAALLYSVLLGALVWSNRRENRASKVYFLAAWYATALATMAKGAPGLVLPLFILGATIALHNDWKQLTRADIGGLVLVTACVCLPWFVQMYLRHGPGFIDRLLLHDMYKRAFEHVHDTNQGDDVSFRYYVWQLGYGLFPWNGVCAAGLVWWFRRERNGFDHAHRAALVLFIWAIAAFGMFTVTLTKFHHYILPMVPPIAVLAGLVLHDALGEAPSFKQSFKRTAGYCFGLSLGVLLMTLGAAFCLPGSLIGTAEGEIASPRPIVGGALILAGVVVGILTALRLGSREENSQQADALQRLFSPALGVVGFLAAAATLLAGRDLAVEKKGDLSGSIRLVHLFTYQYKRPWPESLDFRPALLAFTLVSSLLFLAWLHRRSRSHATFAAGVLSVLFAGWVANVYVLRSAQHWGQRETVAAYYQARKGPEEPLVAFQMNWKGENFYTGNRMPAFVSTGKKFKSWVDEKKAEGVKAMFFTSEHPRMGSLKRELGNPEQFEVLTDEALNNKFFLARVQFD